MQRRLAIPVLCLILCAVVACRPSDFERVAKGIDGVAIIVGGLQKTIIEANLRETITTDNARAIMKACQKISEANDKASRLTRQLHRLSRQDRIDLFQVLHPVLAIVDEANTLDLVGITDPNLRAIISAAFGSLQLGLRAIEAALVAGGRNNG